MGAKFFLKIFICHPMVDASTSCQRINEPFMNERSGCGAWAPDPVHSDHDVQNGPNLVPKQAGNKISDFLIFLFYETRILKVRLNIREEAGRKHKMVISYVIILKDLSLSFNQSECEIMKSTKSLDRYALLFPCIMHMPRIWKGLIRVLFLTCTP